MRVEISRRRDEESEALQVPWKAFSVVAIAASAGGLNALMTVLAPLPATFPAAVLVIEHLAPGRHSYMAAILGRRTALTVREAKTGDRLTPGVVFVAPPDRHLLVNDDDRLALSQGQMVQFVRPSANVLFESVAAHYHDRAIAVVLSGTGSDGAEGASTVKRLGGIVIAQDPHTAEYPGMPEAAIRTGDVDVVLPLNGIAPYLEELVAGRATR